MPDSLRLDHYLFRARLFKSRSQATSACREGRVLINDQPAKAAADVRAGDLIKIRRKGLYWHVRVLELPGRNVAKRQARETWADETPADVRARWERVQLASNAKGPRRDGPRPTKKERREMEKLRGF
ncbi:MAG: hypothetical protein MAG453_00876 [Calditrichaeota bacterium]|nr:hypothetical protein [Calditrichota bacterium]